MTVSSLQLWQIYEKKTLDEERFPLIQGPTSKFLSMVSCSVSETDVNQDIMEVRASMWERRLFVWYNQRGEEKEEKGREHEGGNKEEKVEVRREGEKIQVLCSLPDMPSDCYLLILYSDVIPFRFSVLTPWGEHWCVASVIDSQPSG